MTAVPRSTLCKGAAVVARGIREQPRWFGVAVVGSALYGIMTGAMAWVIGRLTATVIGPAVAAREVTAGQLWQIGLTISAVVLLNVAGIIQPFVKVADLSFEDMERVMDVNFWGVVNTTKAALPHLVTRPEACLVNVSSMGGFCPVPGQSVYGASKAAVKLFTEALYAEVRGTGVAVTVVFPGAIRTGISDNSGVSMGGADGSSSTAAAEESNFPMTEPAEAARQIIEAVVKGSYRITIGKDATMLDRISRLAPQRATDMIAKKMASLLG